MFSNVFWFLNLTSWVIALPNNFSDKVQDLALKVEWPYVKQPFHEFHVQSPTDINLKKARAMAPLSPVVFHRTVHLVDECVEIENTGYYLEILLEEGVKKKPYITGGPLFGNNYIFEQMHFHWGNDDNCGSEHHINGKCYSTEVHAVFYHEKYGSFDAAKNFTDGVTVIAFFGEATDVDNPYFNHLVSSLNLIQEPHSKTTGSFKDEFEFVNILFEQKMYYAFPGSLTTPDYNECVTWIMYTNPFKISHRQLDAFRQLKSKDGKGMIRMNDRELQEFGDRPIVYPLFNKQFEVESDESDESSNIV